MDFSIFEKELKDLTEEEWDVIVNYVKHVQHVVKFQNDLIERITNVDS